MNMKLFGRQVFIGHGKTIMDKGCVMVGNDFPVLIKFTPYHGVEGGRELSEGLEMAKILEEAGVAALHVDVGCYEAWYKEEGRSFGTYHFFFTSNLLLL